MKTLTSIGIQKIGQRFVDSVDHAEHAQRRATDSGALPPLRAGRKRRVYIYFDVIP